MNIKKVIGLFFAIMFIGVTNVNAESVYPRSNEELELLYAIVMVESGTVPEGNQAVTSVILNRVKDDRFPDTITEVITQRGQFASYGHPISWQYMNGNVPQSVKDNVDFVLENGSIISQKFFWADWYYNQSGRWDSEAVNIGGNVFFEF